MELLKETRIYGNVFLKCIGTSNMSAFLLKLWNKLAILAGASSSIDQDKKKVPLLPLVEAGISIILFLVIGVPILLFIGLIGIIMDSDSTDL